MDLHQPPGPDETLVSVLRRHAEARPKFRVLTWLDSKLQETQHLDYESLWKQSGHVASLLLSHQVQKGDRVMIAYPFGLDFIAGMLGCMRLGVVACSVYPPNPNRSSDLETFRKQVADAGAVIALTTNKFKVLIGLKKLLGRTGGGGLGVTWIATDGKPRSTSVAAFLPGEVSPSQADVAFIQYTSGSTGSPKGVVLSHKSVINCVHYACQTAAPAGALSDNDDLYDVDTAVGVSWLPQYHDMGLLCYYMAAAYGGIRGYGISPLDFIKNPVIWNDAIVKFGGTTTAAPNFSYGLLIKRLQQRQERGGDGHAAKTNDMLATWTSMRRVLCAAEPVDPAVMQQVMDILGVTHSAIRIGYGLAECGAGVAAVPLDVVDHRVACLTLEGMYTRARIVAVIGENDNDSGVPEEETARQLAPVGTVGEVWIQAPRLVAQGYWGQEQLTRQTFHNTLQQEEGHWLATGDLGTVVGDSIYITGRAKEVIIVNGRNVIPVDIERTVENAYTSIRPGCVVAFQYGDGVGLVAEIRKNKNGKRNTPQKDAAIPSAKDLCSLISSSHQVDVEYILLLKDHNIPKTTSGKLKRVQVREQSLASTWKGADVVSSWNKQGNTPYHQTSPSSSAAVVQAADNHLSQENEEGELPNFVMGARHNTQCPHARRGLETFFCGKEPGSYYRHEDGVLEDATVDYDQVISELASLQSTLRQGNAEKSFDLVSSRCADTRFWTSVPGVCPHRFALGQQSKNHDENRPWAEDLANHAPSKAQLRSSAADFIRHQGALLSTLDIGKWTMSTISSMLEKPVKFDIAELALFQGRVFDMVMCPQTRCSDQEILDQKARYVKELVEHSNMTEEKACLFIDLTLFAAAVVLSVIRSGVAVLTGANSRFQLDENFKLDESNARLFVWECIRLFPPQEMIPTWKDGKRHVTVIGITGRDKNVWGEDVNKFRPSRATEKEYEAKSCFFAEQATGYDCPTRHFAIDMVAAFLLEFVALGPWKCASKNQVRHFDVAPFFEDFHLRKLPSAIIVGAGAAGLSCALTLAKRGLKVTVLERNDMIGGHARHTEVFGGHERNPAFGAFHEAQWPNLVQLTDELGVERVPLCSFKDFRCNFSANGDTVQAYDEVEVARFLSGMKVILRRGVARGEPNTLGSYLESNGFDDRFIATFVLEQVIHFFAGLKVGEYLDLPLSLAAWIVTSSAMEGPDATVFRLRNKEYMGAFRSKLSELGVQVITGCTSKVLSRDSTGVLVETSTSAGDRVIQGDFLILGVPPDSAYNVLGTSATAAESILKLFDCRQETVVLHQDMSLVLPSASKSVLFGLLPEVGVLPSNDYTIPLTTKISSDTDGKTDILVTHAYDSFAELSIQGPQKHMSFTHVRITHETMQLRKMLASLNGTNNTFYIGGWTRGFMLHEDAIASGMEGANEILKSCGEAEQHVLQRAVELPFTVVTKNINAPTVGDRVAPAQIQSGVEQLSFSSKQNILEAFQKTTGYDVRLADKLSGLGLSSLKVTALHSTLLDSLPIQSESFPIDWLFDGDLTVNDLALRLNGVLQEIPSGLPVVHEGTNTFLQSERLPSRKEQDIYSIFHEQLGYQVNPRDRLGDLGLSSLKVTALHTSLLDALSLVDDELPITWLFDGDLTVSDLISRVGVQSVASVQSCVGDAEPSGGYGGDLKGTQMALQPYMPPPLVSLVSIALQIIAISFQPLFLGSSLVPSVYVGIWLSNRTDPWVALAAAPLLFLLQTLSAGILLVVIKWSLVGRQKPGHTAVWSAKFAARWIVRQCAGICFLYTTWRYLGETEALNILHRLLGCRVGEGASLHPGCIIDYDLVCIGDNSLIQDGQLVTEDVSLGVMTLAPVTVGARCFVAYGSVVSSNAELKDDVTIRPRTLVPTGSVLWEGVWQGKPAELASALDVESGLPERRSVAKSPSPPVTFTFSLVRYATALLLAPYLWTASGLAVTVSGMVVKRNLGSWGLAALIWVPASSACLLMAALMIVCKKLLLGTVKDGRYPRFGSFHSRKYVVDHLVHQHFARWFGYSVLCGSPIGSFYVESKILRLLGPKIGKGSFHTSITSWISYDLLKIGSKNFWGGFADCSPWTIDGDSLVGKSTVFDDGCYIGLNAFILSQEIGAGATVAAFSVATTNLGDQESVFGTQMFNINTEESQESQSSVVQYIRSLYLSRNIGLCCIWGLSAAALGLVGTYAPGDNGRYLDYEDPVLRTLVPCALVGIGLTIVMGFYGFFTSWIMKRIVVGSYFVNEFAHEDRSWRRSIRDAFSCVERALGFYVQESFRGTFVEIMFYKGMGCRIGTNVYLDGPWMFEYDLVDIGDHSSVGRFTGCVPHHASRTALQHSALRIGKRCTIGQRSCIHGRDHIPDDTRIESLTMPVIGSKLSRGTWMGYPAKRIGDNAYQPPRPSDPVWYVLLHCPTSIAFGLYWMVMLFLDRNFPRLTSCCRGRGHHSDRQQAKADKHEDYSEEIPTPSTARSSEGSLSVISNDHHPLQLKGIYQQKESGRKLRFDTGEWYSSLRHLRLHAGSYMSSVISFDAVNHGISSDYYDASWWRFATYDFDFDAASVVAAGQVSLGRWKVPRSIVSPQLRLKGGDWILSHGWFNGDPAEEMRFHKVD